MTDAVHFSSTSIEWSTPDSLWLPLRKEYKFTLDVCANEDNAKIPNFLSGPCLVEQAILSGYYYGDCECGLHGSWGRGQSCWMNPPYGRRNAKKGRLFGIEDWVRKAAYECLVNGNLVVALLPSRTDAAWWHDWVSRANERDYLRGRVRFDDSSSRATLNAAPFPSVLAVFEPPSLSIMAPMRGAAA